MNRKIGFGVLAVLLGFSGVSMAQQCDPTGDGEVSTTDALIVLRAAVGQAGAVAICEGPTTTTTTTTTTTGTTTTTTLYSGPTAYMRFQNNVVCSGLYANYTLRWITESKQWTAYTDEFSAYSLAPLTVHGTFRLTTANCTTIEWTITQSLKLSKNCTLGSTCPDNGLARYRWNLDFRGDEVPPPEQGVFLVVWEEPDARWNFDAWKKKWGEWKAN